MFLIRFMNKVAKITFIFWLLKILATTLGETLGDYISMTLELGYSVALGITASFFFISLITQLNVKQFLPPVYWLLIVATTTLGTEISDFIDRSLHLGYALGSLILIIGLVTTLLIWYRKFHNVSVYPITEKSKELYYWTAILFSNSLGTAFGDFLSDNLGFSYLQGAGITGAIIGVVIGLHYLTRINDIALFWIAFVFTRPFGATFGDFLTKPIDKGGLNLGTLNASLVSMALMIVLVVVSSRSPRFQNNKKV